MCLCSGTLDTTVDKSVDATSALGITTRSFTTPSTVDPLTTESLQSSTTTEVEDDKTVTSVMHAETTISLEESTHYSTIDFTGTTESPVEQYEVISGIAGNFESIFPNYNFQFEIKLHFLTIFIVNNR